MFALVGRHSLEDEKAIALSTMPAGSHLKILTSRQASFDADQFGGEKEHSQEVLLLPG